MIEQISFPTQSIQPKNQAQSTENSGKSSFSDMLKKSLETVNEAQLNSDRLTNALAAGQNVELHDVMIAAQKASILLEATVEFRNKVIEAYQEVMRMQI
ncbi:flagellar hook-basal body complex protein FliE [Aeribacillus composti]|uniref:flagellar hook-basal body complex protein FliE n=1 Tax=Aeribacillus composti TaxID=1868734 RepID=UPI002E22F75D|nr:flagellar hook-basal body complex protein FliE [Aeribacillus composti]